MKKILIPLLSIIFLSLFPSSVRSHSGIEFDQNRFLLQTSGKPLEETILLENFTDSPAKVNLSWVPYSKSAVKVVDQRYLTKHSIDFAHISEEVVKLQPFETKPINIVFSLPSEINSGDYFGYLAAESSVNNTKADFTIRVLGQLTEGINANAYFKDGYLITNIENIGNQTVLIKAKLLLGSLFGSKKNVVNEKSLNLLPGEVQTLKSGELDLLPGHYQAEVKLNYGSKNLEKVILVSFWVHPEFFLVSAATLFLSFLLFIYFRKYLKKND